ncbi:alkaline phosphatase-like [Ptychodera flava]|uniref:alkaline phosphatase-like n=1 Tax=Ptychodera flava TaxID=63121 RepID=UPI00396AB17C
MEITCTTLLACYAILSGLLLNQVHTQPASEWYQQGRQSIERALELEDFNLNVAKNAILFLGDGMGVATLASARIKKGQDLGSTGEEHQLEFEKFPHLALSKTYNTNYQVSDSAGTATAFLAGAKTKRGVVGQDDRAIRGDCAASSGSDIPSILEIAQQHGKSVGIVTTTRVTHATPAAAYAHIPDRDWEADSDIPSGEQGKGCTDIALQMVENHGIQVVMGGGRQKFMLNTQRDPEAGILPQFGDRQDGRDLIKEWVDGKPEGSAVYVWNEDDFENVDPTKTDYLLGLFDRSHMTFEDNRGNDNAGEPHIANMTRKAIEILSKNVNGFFLLVEGGRIDHAHHANTAYSAVYDTIAFDEAVKMAKDMTSSSETLIVVTADHSHTNTFSGYPNRGNPILGKNDRGVGSDGLPYTTVMYSDGPGGVTVTQSYQNNGLRPNITDTDTEQVIYVSQALVSRASASHAGEDVTIFADGPMAHLFHGVHEQSYIPHVMQYASCIGDYSTPCRAVTRDSRAFIKGKIQRYDW